ncbi:hypothetical protein CJ673_03825 [Aliarcobacter cryaerophilus]|uniref:Uncharacterized protein n=1 Tax=Aliarcobacter cryaerophilus TaxID=28198 RepID=A0A2S9TB07_9BACT|nr:hypothetical protein [Aliarcobacter cryaerophilus]PRM96017.1 hypothetical protein CJ673_03825 [Aliarcobacter cryaerophilus]
MNKEERVFLEYFVNTMEQEGLTLKAVYISFTQEELQKINKIYSTNISMSQMETNLNKLLSHEHLKHAFIGEDKFSGLQLTLKGLGVVNSLKKKEESNKNKGMLKRVSDYVEDHKGIFLVLGFLITLITLFLKFKGN